MRVLGNLSCFLEDQYCKKIKAFNRLCSNRVSLARTLVVKADHFARS